MPPEVWLRGPINGIQPLLQPAAHALLQVGEDVLPFVRDLTPANTKRYIDFAAANGLGGVLVEGWNTGWDGDWIENRDAFSFTQSYPDYDLKTVADYARSKGVRLIVHNETSGGIANYERQMDSAFTLYRSLGLDAIKSGYVTDLTSEGHSHYSQYMVDHYRKVIEATAAIASC